MGQSHSHILIAVGCQNGNVKLCDVRSGSSLQTLKGHRKGVMSVRWSPLDEHLLASGSQDNQILLWDIRRGKIPLKSLDLHNSSLKGSGNHQMKTWSIYNLAIMSVHEICGIAFNPFTNTSN
jgi:DNA excision repair protein ERCC-8